MYMNVLCDDISVCKKLCLMRYYVMLDVCLSFVEKFFSFVFFFFSVDKEKIVFKYAKERKQINKQTPPVIEVFGIDLFGCQKRNKR